MRVNHVKPISLNQLLFHPKCETLSFFCQSLDLATEDGTENFLHEVELQLEIQGLEKLSQLLKKNEAKILKIIRSHKDKAHGFFFGENLQGYVILENNVESFYTNGDQFHVRPLLEELFTHPEFLLVNISLYDVKVYRGDFQHVEIIHQFEFDQLPKPEAQRCYAPQYFGLIPYKTIMALKSIAQKVSDLMLYHALPAVITGLEEVKAIFLKYFDSASS